MIGVEFKLGVVRKVWQRPVSRARVDAFGTFSQRSWREGVSELEPMLSELQLGEFIYEQPTSGDIEYTFKHALPTMWHTSQC